MGSGQAKIAVDPSALFFKTLDSKYVPKTRNGGGGGAADDPIDLSSASPSPSATCTRPQRPNAVAPKSSTRIDENGRIKKLSSVQKGISQILHDLQHTLPKQQVPTVSIPKEAPKQGFVQARPVEKLPAVTLPPVGYAIERESLARKSPVLKKLSPKKSPRRSVRLRRSPAPRQSNGLDSDLENLLLVITQKLLEHVLFYWTKEWVPEVLDQMNWKSAVKGELNLWIRAWNTESAKIYRALIDSNAGIRRTDLNTLIYSLHDLRHAAVHRKDQHPLTTILGWMRSAVLVAEALDDPLRRQKLSEMEATLKAGDLSRLAELIEKPLLEFKDAGSRGAEVTDAKSTTKSRFEQPSLQSNVSTHFQDFTTFRNDGDKVLQSIEREFGDRKENQQSMSSNRQAGSELPLTQNPSRAEVVDLTEEGEGVIDVVKHLNINSERGMGNVEPTFSKKRTFAVFQQDTIEMSDDEGTYPIEEDSEEDEDPDAISLPSVRQPGLTAAYLRARRQPIMGLDY